MNAGQSRGRAGKDVTVAICTWNRAAFLDRTLASFHRLCIPEGIEWELIVVDNNCTDTTPNVVQRHREFLPIYCVSEKQQGHSASRNAAVEAARGELLIWTDDDVLVDSNWLSAYWDAFQYQSEISFWGGVIRPDFESPPPSWVESNWEICSRLFAIRESKAMLEPMTATHLPFGANFAIRTPIQRQQLYDVEFGRSGQSMRGFDEIDVLRRLMEKGHRGGWCPEAELQHCIPRERVSLDYVKRYFQGQGETLAYRGETRLSPEELRCQLKRRRRKYRLNRWLKPSNIWLKDLIDLSRLEGQLTYLQKHSERLS